MKLRLGRLRLTIFSQSPNKKGEMTRIKRSTIMGYMIVTEKKANPSAQLSVPPPEVRAVVQEIPELSEALPTSDGSQGNFPVEVKDSDLEESDTVPGSSESSNNSSDSLDSHEDNNPDLPPHRSARETRPPAWMWSNDYVTKMSQGQRVAECSEPEWLMKANHRSNDLAQLTTTFCQLTGEFWGAILQVVLGSLHG